MLEITLEELEQDLEKYFDIARETEIKVTTENGCVIVLSEDKYNNLKQGV